MENSRSDRWMALAGPLFLVVFIVMMAFGDSTPKEAASGASVIDFYKDDMDTRLISVFSAVPAIGLLLLFTSRLAGALRKGSGRKLLQYGAILYAGAIATGAVFELAVVSASDNKQAAAAEAINVVQAALWILPVAGAAVMLLGAGLALRGSAVLPSWMGWVALVVGVISFFGPGGFAGYMVTPLWIAIAGIMLYLRGDDVPAPYDPATTSAAAA